jgi:hypothetical protein
MELCLFGLRLVLSLYSIVDSTLGKNCFGISNFLLAVGEKLIVLFCRILLVLIYEL